MLIPVGKVLVYVPDACRDCPSEPAPEWLLWLLGGILLVALLALVWMVIDSIWGGW